MKSVCTFLRRDGLTRQEFQDYYETKHAPLGQSHFPFTRYVRNHVEDMPDIPFETITEFWADDLAELARVLEGPAGAIMAEDEARCMQRDRCEAGTVDEVIISDGVPTDAAGTRDVVLVRYGADAALARQTLQAWAEAIGAAQAGVSLDVLRPLAGERSFPADALLWLPQFAKAAPAPTMLNLTVVRVRRCETPLSDLLPYRNERSATAKTK